MNTKFIRLISLLFFSYFKNFCVSFDSSMKTCNSYNSDFANQIDGWNIFKNLYNNNFLNSKNKSINAIPRIIHWIWLGSPLPEKYKRLQQTWKKFNPDWDFRIWTDGDVKKFNLKNQIKFNQTTNFGAQSDIFRYEILFRYGGIYVDVDFECLKSFDILCTISDFFAGIAYDSRPLLYNGLIGASPGHPIIAACVENVQASMSNDAEVIMNNSGPYFFSRMFFKTINQCKNCSILTLPVTYLYPFPNTLRHICNSFDLNLINDFIKPESFAVHYWGISWS